MPPALDEMDNWLDGGASKKFVVGRAQKRKAICARDVQSRLARLRIEEVSLRSLQFRVDVKSFSNLIGRPVRLALLASCST